MGMEIFFQQFKYNTTILEDDEKKKEYSLALTNRFQALQYLEEETIDEQWRKTKEVVTSTCNEILGSKNTTIKNG